MKKILLLILCCGLCHSLLKAQTNQFVTYNAANEPSMANTGNLFKCVGISDSGVIWAGTQYKGLYLYDTTLDVWTQSGKLTNVFINQIMPDKKGGIWIAQSGTSGQTGGGSNIGGGINYFPDPFDIDMVFYSVPGTTTGGGLVSRNVRSIYVDTVVNRLAIDTSLPRVWAAEATYITSGNTATGGISTGLNSTASYFFNTRRGLDVAPFNGNYPVGTPSCDAVGGDINEVWISVRQNFGKSQIISYNPLRVLNFGGYIGSYDNTNVKDQNGNLLLAAGFRAQAIYCDKEHKRWVGLQNGGLVVRDGTVWTGVNMPSIFPVGTVVNNNAITEDDFGNVYIGTNNGLVVYDGGGPVDDTLYYTRLTTSDSIPLPSNNITGIAYDRKYNRMIFTSDAGVTFWTVNNKIKVNTAWDWSYPDRTAFPRGVAADGVSRIYLKIKNGNNSLPPISKVKVSIRDYNALDSSLYGTLKKAVDIYAYSEEASSGTDVSVENSNYVLANDGSKEFWFWYVSPKDFCKDSLAKSANAATRIDYLRVVVTYAGGATDTATYKVKVVRPPLLLVHGLASGPETWDNFAYHNTILFKGSNVFKYKRALIMDGRGAFINNAKLLLSGDLAGFNGAKNTLNTLQGNIEELRNMKYAANQVDYVCHSMGGIMIRYAIESYNDKFNAGLGDNYKYKTYKKGFTHKIIFINTPHNSSPVADAVAEFIPLLPKHNNQILAGLFYLDPDLQKPFDFIQPVDPDPNAIFRTTFKASDAVSNLQVKDGVGVNGGVNLKQTNAKFHIIAGNVKLLSPQTTATMAAFYPTLKSVENLIESMLNSKFVPKLVKERLKPFLKAAEAGGWLTFWEWYCENKNFPGFLSSSDIIVPLESQVARLPLFGVVKKYTRVFDNLLTFFDASHVTILGRKDVGQHVFNLLNSGLADPIFGDVVPANTDPDPKADKDLTTPPSIPPYTPYSRPANINGVQQVQAITEFYDTSKIKIDSPVRGGPLTMYADSLMNIVFRLKDTTNLSYIHIHFQNSDTFIVSKSKAQQTIPLKISAAFPNSQNIWAVAGYDMPDSSMNYYIDTFSVSVQNKATIQGFRVNDSNIVVNGGTYYYPPYQVMYNNVWTNLPVSDVGINASFEPTGVINLGDTVRTLSAITEGATTVIFQYKTFTDTMLIETQMPLASFCINKTIASGNFKNPAIWSKKVIPDICDSVVIDSSFTVTVDTTVQCTSLRISHGGTLNLSNAAITLKIGAPNEGNLMVDNYGTLNITNGNLSINGQLKLNAASTFNMTGGQLTINGNTSLAQTSLADGLFLLDAAPLMQSFSFTGGTMQITDPPIGANSQAINCAYLFGVNSILKFGDGVSTTASLNTNGYGGNLLPATIGNLILDAGTMANNRIFINLSPLTVKKSLQVKSGKLVQSASLHVTQ
jgi:pimeloyl-ACP methyl ester carboxylesterase